MTEFSHETASKELSPKRGEKQEEPDSSEDAAKKRDETRVIETMEQFRNMGGTEFEAEQQRILHELNKQKDTIKALLDEMQSAKKERQNHNIKTIFSRKIDL
uniref:Uncharacterized protein n=1 Tax=Caenorhabditis japonica TaxID=281687 RepID=A0A8R1I737_CAEJA